MTAYYEAHITILAPIEEAKLAVAQTNWKFSAIEGDIALGDGVKCYATRHFNERLAETYILGQLHNTADFIASRGVKVIRRKLERVVYDNRSVKVQPGTCEGACIECHIEDYEERDVRLRNNTP